MSNTNTPATAPPLDIAPAAPNLQVPSSQIPAQPMSPSGQAMPMMQDPKQALLAQMHDVKTPDPISWWPLAPGWWLIISLILAAIITPCVLYLRKQARNRYRKQALAQLDEARQVTSHQKQCQEVMQILKRTFFTAYPTSRKHVAGIQGKQWLGLLDKTTNKSLSFINLEKDIDRALYQPPTATSPPDNTVLFNMAEQWIKFHCPMSETIRKEIVSVDSSSEAIRAGVNNAAV